MKSLLTTFLLLACSWNLIATPPAGKPTQVLLVGVHYLPADMLKSNRQQELDQVVQSLALFNPNQILVDVPFDSRYATRLGAGYEGYLMGLDQPNHTAQEQLGFRLAERVSLPQIGAFGANSAYELGSTLQHIQTKDTPSPHVSEFLSLGRGVETAKQYHLYEGSIGQYLTFLNDPVNLEYEHSVYVEGLSNLDASYDHKGARMLADWYAYHAELFANLKSQCDGEGGRIVVLVKSSHIPLLADLLEADRHFQVVPSATYLNVQ